MKRRSFRDKKLGFLMSLRLPAGIHPVRADWHPTKADWMRIEVSGWAEPGKGEKTWAIYVGDRPPGILGPAVRLLGRPAGSRVWAAVRGGKP